MSTVALKKEHWQAYFDNFSKIMAPTSASLEIVSKNIGDQSEVTSLKLEGISYDPKDNALGIQLGDGMDHLIQNPQEIYVTETNQGLSSMEVTGSDGAKHILTLDT